MDEIKAYENQLKGKRILFLMPSLSTGGAERVMLTIIKYLDKSRFEPILMVLNEGTHALDYRALVGAIEFHNLEVSRARLAYVPLYKTIRKVKPDTVLSTLGFLNETLSLMLPLLPKIHFIARESSIPSLRNKKDSNTWIHNLLYRYAIPNFNQIIVQSKEMKDDLMNLYQISEDKLVLIDNPIDTEYILEMAKEPCKELNSAQWNIIAVGSLKPVKNYNQLLLEASQSPDNYRYYILGEGSQRQVLEARIGELDLSEKVFLLGHQTNPWKYMANCHEFWQKSKWEGNSNALKEWKLIQSLKETKND